MSLLLAALLAAAAPAGIPAGTPVPLTTGEALDSRTARQGQRVALSVRSDVAIDGMTVIRAGTPAVGEIEELSGKGMFGKAGRLTLTPLFVTLPGGRRLFLSGRESQRGTRQVAGAAVTTVLLSGLGMFITGKSAVVPPGTPIEGEVRSDFALEPAAP